VGVAVDGGGACCGGDETGAADKMPCDVLIRAVCVDAAGAAAPFLLPPQATVRAALYCGVHPVSQLGDIPVTARGADEPANNGTTGVAGVCVYDAAEEAVEKVVDGLTVLGSGSAAAAHRRRATVTSIGSGSSGGGPGGGGQGAKRTGGAPSTRGGRAMDRVAEADDDTRSERSGGSGRGGGRGDAASVATTRTRGAMSMAFTAAGSRKSSLLPSSEYSTLMGMTAPLRDDHTHLDDASARLRRRNAASVVSLSLPASRRHAHDWVEECGLVMVEGNNTLGTRPRASSLADVVDIRGALPAAVTGAVGGVGGGGGFPGATRMPEYLTSGPDGNTIIVSDTVAAAHTPSQATELAREAHERQSHWMSCSSAGVHASNQQAASPPWSLSPSSGEADDAAVHAVPGAPAPARAMHASTAASNTAAASGASSLPLAMRAVRLPLQFFPPPPCYVLHRSQAAPLFKP